MTLKHRLINFLQATQRITKTDNLYIAKSGFYLSVTHAMGILSGVVLYILIGRFLPKETYGQYRYFLSIFGLFGIAAFSGVESALTRAVANGYEGSLVQAFKQKLMGGFIGSFICVLVAGYYVSHQRSDLAYAFVLIALLAPWIYAGNIYGAFLNGKKEFRVYGKINTCLNILAALGMAIVFVTSKRPLILLIAFLCTSLVNIIGFIYARRHQRNDAIDPDMKAYAFHLSGLDVFGVIANSIDSILIFHFLGAQSLAIYSLAIIPVEQVKGFLKIFQSLAFPKLTLHAISAVHKTFVHKIRLFIIGTACLIGIYILAAPIFFHIFFPLYQDSALYSQVYSLSLILGVPASLYVTLFTAKGLRRETMLFTVISYSLQIIFLVIGSWLYGIWGAILARLLSRSLMFLTSHRLFQRVLSQDVEMRQTVEMPIP